MFPIEKQQNSDCLCVFKLCVTGWETLSQLSLYSTHTRPLTCTHTQTHTFVWEWVTGIYPLAAFMQSLLVTPVQSISSWLDWSPVAINSIACTHVKGCACEVIVKVIVDFHFQFAQNVYVLKIEVKGPALRGAVATFNPRALLALHHCRCP